MQESFEQRLHLTRRHTWLYLWKSDGENVLQIGCGDLFENKVVDEFNECAVTRKGCVPQKADEGRFPVPAPSSLVQDFDTTRFTGTWYITSGLNKTFDTFDCQKHEFTAEPAKLSGVW